MIPYVHPLIGLVGQKQVGKDTLAAALCLHLDYSRVAFADLLKDVAYATNPLVMHESCLTHLCSLVDRVGWDSAKKNKTVRTYLQRLGTAIRTVDEDFWIKNAAEVIEAIDGPVVVTDVRYLNEAEFIRENGGLLVRITRPGFGNTDPHPSEQELHDIEHDFLVLNSGTVDDLEDAAFIIEAVVQGER